MYIEVQHSKMLLCRKKCTISGVGVWKLANGNNAGMVHGGYLYHLKGYEGAESLEWVSIFFTKIGQNLHRCNACDVVLAIGSNEVPLKKQLHDHIACKHKEIYELNKVNTEEQVGFKIEFLQLNDMNDEQQSNQPKIISVTQTKTFDNEPQDEQPAVVAKKDKKKIIKASSPRGQINKRRSWVWKYFESVGPVTFRCVLCESLLSIKGSNTNNMNRHVKSMHPSIYASEIASPGYVRRKDPADPVTEVGYEVEVKSTKGDVAAVADKGKGQATTPTKMIKRSWIWSFFNKISPTVAQCKICDRSIHHGGNATGNMNRHVRYLHKSVYNSSLKEANKTEDVSWIWNLFTVDESNYYCCKICSFKCFKFDELEKSINFILDHLKSEHGVFSGDQIITSQECETSEVADVDECTMAVDFLKDTEEEVIT